MANGALPKASEKDHDEEEGFLLRSGPRWGLKREFSFALKSQSQFTASLSRTRSSRKASQNSVPPSNGVPTAAAAADVDGHFISNKRLKTSERSRKPPIKEDGLGIETPNPVDGGDRDAISTTQNGPTDKPRRRFTRSMLKADDSKGMEAAAASSLPSSCKNKVARRGKSGNAVSLLRTSTKKKLELKMSKKIVLDNFPSNVKELLATGLLEGLKVKYVFRGNKKGALRGKIKDGGILCSCTSCKGHKVISASQFERHAGSNNRYTEQIYLENGNNIRQVLNACNGAPLEMLEATIMGMLPVRKAFICRKCKETYYPSRVGKSMLVCNRCWALKQPQASPTRGGARLQKQALKRKSSDSSSKCIRLQKKNGRLTRKDLRLHKLVFMEDVLPDGTEVAYYSHGKLLVGYKKGNGIFCHCCNSEVTPSQFEAHAGWAPRRKPYQYIYTSNGVSLHELSISLSKGRKFSASDNDDLCIICADGGNLVLCDGCPRAFHKDCAELSCIPRGDWYCRYCQTMFEKEKFVEHNANAFAAGRVLGVDPIEQISKRCIRIVQTPEVDVTVCVLCRCHDFSKSGFGPRTVLLCDQCEKEFHVGCLKEHKMGDLKPQNHFSGMLMQLTPQELPKRKWFCCASCSKIHAALEKLLRHGFKKLPDSLSDVIKRKCEGKTASNGAGHVRWRLLSGKFDSPDSRLLLSKAVAIFHDRFDPIVDSTTGRDLIPSMVYGRNMRDREFGGMFCAVLTVNSSVVSAGIIRIFGEEVAELPLVATSSEKQGQGYFQALFSCIEGLLGSLHVRNLLLPAADEAESIWTKKFGFKKINQDQLGKYTKDSHMMIFQGTSMLHKSIPKL
ncbi:uncharacterized protein LOC131231871 isoform X2 [Magnolia sinica]|uniref:uncharacterized protein LOC131231871 isoform X2 n=1 Tax=Magnolia sinica TaxID=86752 RepID=UPI0026588B80|nr:uncharacterized protein LOC131231871 isoform X2 [Magnolia sinica]